MESVHPFILLLPPQKKENEEILFSFTLTNTRDRSNPFITSAFWCFYFKTGQVLERSTISERIYELEFEKMKQKTSAKLSMLMNEYKEASSVEIPNHINYDEIVQYFVGIDQTLFEKSFSLGLNLIYLDLTCNGTQSVYFYEFLRYVCS